MLAIALSFLIPKEKKKKKRKNFYKRKKEVKHHSIEFEMETRVLCCVQGLNPVKTDNGGIQGLFLERRALLIKRRMEKVR